MDIFEEDFSDWVDVIRARRTADAELDEICRDYELLKTDLRKATREGTEQNNNSISDLKDSLSGLKTEIVAMVKPSE